MRIRNVIFAALFATPAAAQDWAAAIAFVQAPEMSSGVATGPNTGQAIAGALEACVDGGGTVADCEVSAVCSPAGWSVDFFVQHREGFHWHEYFCGLPTEAAAKGMEAVICDAASRPDIIECAAVQIWTESGQPTMEW